jgi:hypothetical protein
MPSAPAFSPLRHLDRETLPEANTRDHRHAILDRVRRQLITRVYSAGVNEYNSPVPPAAPQRNRMLE